MTLSRNAEIRPSAEDQSTCRFAIENPRDGSELDFVSDQDLFTHVQIINDEDDEELGPHDSLGAFQSVVPPAGFTGLAPVIGVNLTGPADVLPNVTLPQTLDLNDWPDASLAFFDFFDLLFGSGEEHSYFFAEIHTLTPNMTVGLPGDFNADGAVNASDYNIWRATFGSASDSHPDGNSNGVVDAADYVVWRHHSG